MLKPFRIRDLQEGSGDQLQDELVQLSAPEYDATISKNPEATLMYMDDDDGETITVGSSLELGQRLDEPVSHRRHPSRSSISRERLIPEPDSPIHIFDINRTDTVLDVWRSFQMKDFGEPNYDEPLSEGRSISDKIARLDPDEDGRAQTEEPGEKTRTQELEDERRQWFWACNPPRIIPVQPSSFQPTDARVDLAKSSSKPLEMPPSSSEQPAQVTSGSYDTMALHSSSLTPETTRQIQDAAAKFRGWKNPAIADAKISSAYQNRWASYNRDSAFGSPDPTILSTNPEDKTIKAKEVPQARPTPTMPDDYIPAIKPRPETVPEPMLSASALPLDESTPFLQAFEAEMARMLASTTEHESKPVEQPVEQSAQQNEHASATSPPTDAPLPLNAGEILVNTIQSLVEGVGQLGAEMKNAFPELERNLSSVQEQVPGHVDRALRGALYGLGTQMGHLASSMQTASEATRQAAERTREADLRAVEGAVDGIRGFVDGISEMGKTLFSAFEAEMSATTSSSGPTAAPIVPPRPASPAASSGQSATTQIRIESPKQQNVSPARPTPPPVPPKVEPSPLKPREVIPRESARSRSPMRTQSLRNGRSRSPVSDERSLESDPVRREHVWGNRRPEARPYHHIRGTRPSTFHPEFNTPVGERRAPPPPPPPHGRPVSMGSHAPMPPMAYPKPFPSVSPFPPYPSLHRRRSWYPGLTPNPPVTSSTGSPSVSFIDVSKQDAPVEAKSSHNNRARRVRSMGRLHTHAEHNPITSQHSLRNATNKPDRTYQAPSVSDAILDQDVADPSFTARYPSLVANIDLHRANTTGSSLRKPKSRLTLSNPYLIPASKPKPPPSPELDMTQFPTVSEFEEQNRLNQLSSEMSAKKVGAVPPVVPGAWPPHVDVPKTESSGEFFERMTGRKAVHEEEDVVPKPQGHLSRSKTVSASNPAARLLRPFDPMSNSFTSTSVEEGLRRCATDRIPPPRDFDGNRRPYSEHFSGDGRMGWESFLQQYEKTPGSFPATDDPDRQQAPLPKYEPQTSFARRRARRPVLRVDTTSTRLARRSRPQPAEKTKAERCVEHLKMLGFGSEWSDGDERLMVYSEAAEGNLEDAIEMIEEERKAYKARGQATM